MTNENRSPAPAGAIAEIRDGRLEWHIPDPMYVVPAELRHGVHYLTLSTPAPAPAVPECRHEVYSVDVHEQTGYCMRCKAEGRMRFVVGSTPAPAPAQLSGNPGQLPTGYVLVPLAVAEQASEALGNFVSDHGWSDADMQAMDSLDAYIAQHKAGERAAQSPVAGPSFSSCSAGGCPDKRGCDAAQHCLYTAPQAPQQAGHIPTVEDIDAQDWAGMDGATAYQVIERHGEDWSHIGRLMAAWLAANQAPGMGALAEDAKRDIDSIIGATAMLGHPAGTGAEAEARPLAADAARYRWLRSGRMFRQGQPTSAHSRRISKDALSALMAFSFWCEPEELDGLIDAEISKAQVTGMQTGDKP